MDRNPLTPNASFAPAASNPGDPDLNTAARQTGEDKGKIKRPQDNPEKNVPRGSEPETHARK